MHGSYDICEAQNYGDRGSRGSIGCSQVKPDTAGLLQLFQSTTINMHSALGWMNNEEGGVVELLEAGKSLRLLVEGKDAMAGITTEVKVSLYTENPFENGALMCCKVFMYPESVTQKAPQAPRGTSGVDRGFHFSNLIVSRKDRVLPGVLHNYTACRQEGKGISALWGNRSNVHRHFTWQSVPVRCGLSFFTATCRLRFLPQPADCGTTLPSIPATKARQPIWPTDNPLLYASTQV
jgi:hypothetical protein